MDCSPPGLCLWNFPGMNTGMGCHFLSSKNTLAETYKMFDHIPGQHGSAKLTHKINHLNYNKKKVHEQLDKTSPFHFFGSLMVPLTPITLRFIQFSSVQSVMSDSLRPHEPQHAKPPCPSPTPGVHPNSCPSSR